ncbi:MAG: 30S ribosome-binding factor RbfA [Salinispira sp.]
MSNFRFEKITSRLQHLLNEIIVNTEIKDHRVNSLLSVSAVELSRDGSHAKIKVSGYLAKNDLDEGIVGLNSAAGYIQKIVASRLHTRRTPKLTFIKDEALIHGMEISQRLKKLSDDPPSSLPH